MDSRLVYDALMDRRLLDYLPPVLREVADMRAVNDASEPEIRAAWGALARVMDDQFIGTADADGLSVWEKELCIQPKDTDTLELRRARIKALWNRKTPYTLPWLRDWLASFWGEGKSGAWTEDYRLRVSLDHTDVANANELAAESLRTLCAVRPANMVLFIENILKTPETKSDLHVTPYFWRGMASTKLPTLEPAIPTAGIYATPVIGRGLSVTKLPVVAPDRGTAAVLCHATAILCGTLTETRLPALHDFDTEIHTLAVSSCFTAVHGTSMETKLPGMKEETL